MHSLAAVLHKWRKSVLNMSSCVFTRDGLLMNIQQTFMVKSLSENRRGQRNYKFVAWIAWRIIPSWLQTSSCGLGLHTETLQSLLNYTHVQYTTDQFSDIPVFPRQSECSQLEMPPWTSSLKGKSLWATTSSKLMEALFDVQSNESFSEQLMERLARRPAASADTRHSWSWNNPLVMWSHLGLFPLGWNICDSGCPSAKDSR